MIITAMRKYVSWFYVTEFTVASFAKAKAVAFCIVREASGILIVSNGLRADGAETNCKRSRSPRA
jgi:hypothetical protein